MTRSRILALAPLLLVTGLILLVPLQDSIAQDDCKDSEDGC